jgi:hypothetical protein
MVQIQEPVHPGGSLLKEEQVVSVGLLSDLRFNTRALQEVTPQIVTDDP